LKRLVHQVAGQEVLINRVETEDDLEGFRNFVRANLKGLAVDSEATGLDMYSDDFRLRLVQFGTPDEAWVLPVEHGGQFFADARKALLGVDKLVFQNGGFDLQVFDQHLDVQMEKLWPKVLDTKILAHLTDPRGREEGGFGHGLEDLTRYYIDADVADNVKGLMTKIAKEHKTTKNKIWSLIDLDHPEYNLYAGMDTILAARLSRKLFPLVPNSARPLIQFEHEVAEICSYMERTGFLLDVEYTENLSAKLSLEEERWTEVAAKLGVENVNSTEQVADGLESMGIRITGRTPSGKRQVDKKLLEELVKAENPLAKAVVEAKRARKWRTTWVDGFLNNRDKNDRCHANIQSLRARTARMSITGIPAQTLPSGDWMIRRCFLADPGHFIGSIDYKAQELRVLAALSGDQTMIKAFQEDADLHLITARSAFGDHITKDNKKERKYAKTVNFGRVYGGGVNTVMEQTGLDRETAKRVVDGFDNAYPGVALYSRKLQQQAIRQGFITTPSGRRLPVDADRAYAALNYMVQSTSRDVTCRGLVKLHKAGFTPYLRLPIHDEVVVSMPMEKAHWGADRIGDLMTEVMGPVSISTDPAVPGKSWGHEYMVDKDDNPDLELIEKADREIVAAGLW
jgi:DNA polymerase-1